MIDFLLFIVLALIFSGGFWLGLYVGIAHGGIGAWFEAIGKRLSEKKE